MPADASSSDAELRALLEEKRAFFRKREAIAANAPEQFQLKKEIEEIEARLGSLSQPTFKDPQTERLSTQLEDLYVRREQLTIAAEDTRALDSEILDVRRLLRKGPQLQPGEFLLEGRYRLVETLGQGGFATVWKAYDRQCRKLVAVKVLHGQHSEDRTRRERFFRGARKMAELIHPNIVRVLAAECRDDGWLFFVMELVAGGDFGQAVLGGTLTDDEKLAIVSQMAEVLEFAHQRGVIHRDVKPANVLLDGNGVAKLTDFDLVRAEDSTGFTQTRAMLGTLSYAAPEALESPKDAGPPADVYSLASTAVFALLGGPLPRGYYRNPGPAIASLGCSPSLARVLTRATVADPEQRFASAGAFVTAIREATVVEEDPVVDTTIVEEDPVVDTTVVEEDPVVEKPRSRKPQPKSRALPLEDELFSSFRTPQGELKPLWCEIPAGIGWIGSPDSEKDRKDREGPRHQVEIVRPFWLASVPVTNAQYAAFDPKKSYEEWKSVPKNQLESHARVDVGWEEAMSFCGWLAERGFKGARLPTEEEWEYACRARSETPYWSGDYEEALARVGWYSGNSGGRAHRVGGKSANPWGLYDVHGNVWEWTASVWSRGEYEKRPQEGPFAVDPATQPADLAAPPGVRVLRGGCCWDHARRTRAAYRAFWDSELGLRGFRVLLPFAPS